MLGSRRAVGLAHAPPLPTVVVGLQALFEEAIDLSQQQGSGSGRCWYPYSYMVGYSTRRAQFILQDASGVLGRPCSSA